MLRSDPLRLLPDEQPDPHMMAMTGTEYEGYRDPLALALLRHAAARPGALAAKDDVGGAHVRATPRAGGGDRRGTVVARSRSG